MGLNWYLGTMGFSYKDWEGVFYPSELDSRENLAYYSNYFNAVEMDSTFYGTPRSDYVERWVQLTPADFVFCPKMPRLITHDLALQNAEAETRAYLETMRLFGDKLGPILIQLPPDFGHDQMETLADFLGQLPDDLRYAVEFRNRSWHTTSTGELLQAQNVCWVSTEYQYMPKRVYVTTNFIYIRWLGRHGSYDTKDHERVDRTERLKEWIADIEERKQEGVDTVYGFFNDEYSGFAPATAQRLQRLLGFEVKPLRPPQQSRLL